MNTSATDLSRQLFAERTAVEALYRAFSDNNPDLVDTVLAPDWNDIPLGPGQEPGPAGIKPIIRGLVAAMPDLTVTIKDWVQEPGKIAVRSEIAGTHLGAIFGIEPTGKKVLLRLFEFHVLSNDLITTTWHIEDWLGLFQQLGAFPPQH